MQYHPPSCAAAVVIHTWKEFSNSSSHHHIVAQRLMPRLLHSHVFWPIVPQLKNHPLFPPHHGDWSGNEGNMPWLTVAQQNTHIIHMRKIHHFFWGVAVPFLSSCLAALLPTSFPWPSPPPLLDRTRLWPGWHEASTCHAHVARSRLFREREGGICAMRHHWLLRRCQKLR